MGFDSDDEQLLLTKLENDGLSDEEFFATVKKANVRKTKFEFVVFF